MASPDPDLVAPIAEFVRRVVREEVAHAVKSVSSTALISIQRAADRLDASVSYVRQAIREGRLPAYRIGAAIRVRVSDVDALAVRDGADASADRRAKVLAAAKGRP